MSELWPNGEPVHVGQQVQTIGGDCQFRGWIVTAFQKRGGHWRYVVEDERGLLLIHSLKRLNLIGNPP